MKVVEFIKLYGNQLSLDHHIYISGYQKVGSGSMSSVWEQTYKTSILLRILELLRNANYDLPLIFYVIKVGDKFVEMANDPVVEECLKEGITFTTEFYNGRFGYDEFTKYHQWYEADMRRIMSERTGLVTFQRNLMFLYHLAMLQLRGGKPIDAVWQLTKECVMWKRDNNCPVESWYSDLLRNCIGNPFLT